MDWKVFLLRVAVALVLGALIGAERQLRQRLTGLRTNALVSTGACLFVLMTQGVPGLAGDASRIAAYVVSGIGFLGGGVIMRDGLNVRGLNTAATLWCTAAIGVLCSMGLLLEATLGSLVVLCANILLRDIAQRLNCQDVLPASEAEQRYEVQIVCRAEDEIQVRSLMLHSLGSSDLRLQSLHSEDLDNPASWKSAPNCSAPRSSGAAGTPGQPGQPEKGVSSVRWQVFRTGGRLSGGRLNTTGCRGRRAPAALGQRGGGVVGEDQFSRPLRLLVRHQQRQQSARRQFADGADQVAAADMGGDPFAGEHSHQHLGLQQVGRLIYALHQSSSRRTFSDQSCPSVRRSNRIGRQHTGQSS